MSGDTQSGPYAAAYQRSTTDPDGFWREAAALIDWYTEPTRIMDDSALPFSRWFASGVPEHPKPMTRSRRDNHGRRTG